MRSVRQIAAACLLLGVLAPSAQRAVAQDPSSGEVARFTLRGLAVDPFLLEDVPAPSPDLLRTRTDLRVEAAAQLLATNQPLAAMAILREIISADPENKQARMAASSAFILAGRHREARDLLEALVRKYPYDHLPFNNLAWFYATVDNPDFRNAERSLAMAREAVFRAPGDYHVWSTLAEAHYVNGHYEQALRAAQEALTLATREQAAAANARTYRAQYDKCRRAVDAFSLVE